MNEDEQNLYQIIDTTFAYRSMPAGRLIEDRVDLEYHLEARDVDQYFRKYGSVVNRDNSVLVAFNYMNAEASFWLLPIYMKTILSEYCKEDFLLDIFSEVLAGGVSAYKKSPENKDLDMRRRATDAQAEVVCRFCRWLKRKQALPAIIDEHSDEAIRIWCTSPSPGMVAVR